MPDLIEFEWSFTPPDLFEERTELLWSGRAFVVDAGKVRVRAEIEGGQGAWQELANELHHVLLVQLLAAQVLSHQPFTLSKPTWARIRPDGGRDVFVTLEGGRINVRSGALDVMHTSASGEVLRDSRKHRIERRLAFAQLAATYVGEPVLESILRSYSAAVNDAGNELVHLYEIRDALADRFGGADAARTALGVAEPDWRRLGELANAEPLSQGRHRGAHLGKLRNATEGELDEARGIACAMIEAYLRYLEAHRRSSTAL